MALLGLSVLLMAKHTAPKTDGEQGEASQDSG